MEQVHLIPRVSCECGWMNNKPSKRAEPYARCSNCGTIINKKYRFFNELKKSMLKQERIENYGKSR